MTPAPAPRRVVPPVEEVAAAPKTPMLPLTTILIALNVAVFLGQIAMDGLHGISDMSMRTLLAFGANFANATRYEDRIETLLTACFVHGSLLHIAFNLVALRQVGTFVERAAGASRMLPLYLISGVVASSTSMFTGLLSATPKVSVGASGAVCGLIGAALVLGYRIEEGTAPSCARWRSGSRASSRSASSSPSSFARWATTAGSTTRPTWAVRSPERSSPRCGAGA